MSTCSGLRKYFWECTEQQGRAGHEAGFPSAGAEVGKANRDVSVLCWAWNTLTLRGDFSLIAGVANHLKSFLIMSFITFLVRTGELLQCGYPN